MHRKRSLRNLVLKCVYTILFLYYFESELILCSYTLVLSHQEASYKSLISRTTCSALGLQADTVDSFPVLWQLVLVPRNPALGRAAGLQCSLPPCAKGQGRLFTSWWRKHGCHILLCYKKCDGQHYKYIVYERDFKIYTFFMKGFLQAGKPGHFAAPVLSLAWLKLLN